MNIDCYKIELENVEPYIIPYRKIKRSERLINSKKKELKLYNKIKSVVYYKPSIHIHSRYDNLTKKYIDDNYLSYGKHSNQQKWMKKYSNKIFRKLKMRELKSNGKIYRKYFDYWWTWF